MAKQETKVYLLKIWNTDETEIVGVFSTYKLADNLRVTIPCASYEIVEYIIDAI